MRAALAAWGSDMNLFQKGFAWESDDTVIINATLEKPGIVLKRPVGSKQRFTENAHLPKDLPADARAPRKPRPVKKAKTKPVGKAASKAASKAAAKYEKEERKRDAQRARQAAAEAKQRARREKAIAKAEAAFDDARKEHDAIVDRIDTDREAIEKRTVAEDTRWAKIKERLDSARRKASQ